MNVDLDIRITPNGRITLNGQPVSANTLVNKLRDLLEEMIDETVSGQLSPDAIPAPEPEPEPGKQLYEPEGMIPAEPIYGWNHEPRFVMLAKMPDGSLRLVPKSPKKDEN